jgi:hypothetical protein
LRELIFVSSQWFRGPEECRRKVTPLREICQINLGHVAVISALSLFGFESIVKTKPDA